MRKITISILNNALLFKYTENKPVSVNLLNTNVISNDELMFSDKYLIENQKITGLFIVDLIREREVNNIIIDSFDMAEIVLNLLVKAPTIECITFNENDTIPYNICEKISKYKNIKKINSYSIPTFMIELLDKCNIIAESRNEVLFTSIFMQENNLNSFSKMYYATNIKINNTLSEDDKEDLKTFLSINKYLKVINFERYIPDNITTVSNYLKQYKRKNILLEVYEDINDPDEIMNLKKIKSSLSSYKIKLSLVYSKDYLEKNYLKQVVFTTLKTCSLIVFVLVMSSIGYVSYSDYQSQKRVEAITSDVKSILLDDIELESPVVSVTDVASYDKLLEVNKDTRGWIKVNNTKVDYPVVQAKNNSYYLTNNYYKQKDYYGWIFMDYRNNPNVTDKNTIIYGHNNYHSDVMFATLQNALKPAWYKNEENLYISFNTMNKKMTWKIFSIYGVEVTSDYLYINFDNDEAYQKFLDKIKNRSNVKLDTPVTTNDKILTLSTCLDNDSRLVIHAVLVQEA
jgi:sortase B